MNYVQLDKNTGDKRLKTACLDEGIVECGLLPTHIRDSDDDVVLEFVIKNDFVTFTFDRRIHFEWGHILAGRNPGILILRQDDNDVRQMNTKTAPRHLQAFKQAFPDWNAVPYRHSVVEVTPTLVFLYQTFSSVPVRTWWANRNEPDWQTELRENLIAHAGGNLPS